ncbi:MAG: FAD-linked oxidase [Flammeovirgaceae bacterium]
MAYPKGVTRWKIDKFTNAHQNFTQILDDDQSFDLTLSDDSWNQLNQLEQYQATTKNLQWVIKKALERKTSIRAMGSGWSFSKVAVSDDAIINTKRLRHKFTLGAELLEDDFMDEGNHPDNFRFLQCGNTIISINDYLENQSNPAKSLRASGGSNGQTIVGAFSTGTHGAALFYGGLQEMIHGIHVVTGPDSHFYIERASKKITSQIFHQKIGATIIHDDDLFNAILVSFGSFGIIHGVLVEVEDKFLLEQKRKRVAFDLPLEKAITQGDFTEIGQHLRYPIEDTAHPLYHFEMAINPHDFEFDNPKKGAYLRIMHKAPYRTDYERIDFKERGHTYGDDVLGLIQSVLDVVQVATGFLNRLLIPKMVNVLFNVAYEEPEDADGTEMEGTIGETFKNTAFRGKIFSVAFGLDRKDVIDVIHHCLAVNKRTKLAGVIAFRFVKGTDALLGFTKFPHTCVMEIDGVDANINHKYVSELAKRLELAEIPYTLHWGKINRILNQQRVQDMYGYDKIQLWKKQRSRIMSPEVQEIFNNEFMERCGLDDYVPPMPFQPLS